MVTATVWSRISKIFNASLVLTMASDLHRWQKCRSDADRRRALAEMWRWDAIRDDAASAARRQWHRKWWRLIPTSALVVRDRHDRRTVQLPRKCLFRELTDVHSSKQLRGTLPPQRYQLRSSRRQPPSASFGPNNCCWLTADYGLCHQRLINLISPNCFRNVGI